MYNQRRLQRNGSGRTGPAQTFPPAPSTRGYISEEDEDDVASSYHGGEYEPDFEMMVTRSQTGRSSRKSRGSASGSMIMPMLSEQQQPVPIVSLGPPVEVKKIRVKVHYEDSRYVMIGLDTQFGDFVSSVRNKFAMMQNFKIKIKDDGDMVTMSDQDDLDMAKEMAKENAMKSRTSIGKMEAWIEAV